MGGVRKQFFICALFCLASVCSLPALALDLFAKGTVSRSSLDHDKWTLSIKASGGFAFSLVGGIKIEARYTNISTLQNKLEVVKGSVLEGTLTDILTETSIYSLGVDIDLLGPRSRFKPFIFLGAGYVVTKRSYDYTGASESSATTFEEPTRSGLSGNAGVGVRWQIGKHFGIEIEAFAYSVDFHKPNPLINAYGSAGVRVSL